MGNVAGREDDAVGGSGEDSAADSETDSGFIADGGAGRGSFGGARRGRGASLGYMGGSPPDSPGRSRSPLMFSPQGGAFWHLGYMKMLTYVASSKPKLKYYLPNLTIPVAPLHRPADVPPMFNEVWMEEPGLPESPQEEGIPTLITWNYGGNEVLLEGSWDNWASRRALQRSGNDFSIMIVLPSGVYEYRFIVDGEWKYIHDLPHLTDEGGNTNNLLDVHDYIPENLESVSEFEAPPSPDSSYGQPFPADEDFTKEPPVVPPQLHMTVLGVQDTETAAKPYHVVLNHLFIEKGSAPQSLVGLGTTYRFQSKYTNVVLYKPLRK